MSRATRLLALGILLYTATALFAACRGQSEEAKSEESVLPPTAATAPVRALMAAVIDPAADVVWQSVATIMTGPTEIEEREPKTDQEWAEVQRNALILIQASDLLLTPDRPMAGPGEKSVAPGVELEPLEIQANVAKNREEWNRHVKAFRDSSFEVLQAIEAKDAKKVFELGEGLDTSCENCHTTFWYPNQPLPPGF